MPIIVAALVGVLSQAPGALPPAEHPDFPRQDRQAWNLQRTGLVVKAARAIDPSRADTTDAFVTLLEGQRVGDALAVLRRIVERQPATMAAAFAYISRNPGGPLHDEAYDYSITLQQIVERGYERLAALPREDAAHAERQLMIVDRRPLPGRSFSQRLLAFQQKYDGTEAAAVAEVELMRDKLRSERDGPRALDDFIARHPADLAGARAQYEKGWYLRVPVGASGRKDGDPELTNRFMQVVAVAAELRSGRYPQSEWVDRGADLVSSFFWPESAVIADTSIPSMVDAYREFLERYAATDALPLSFSVENVLLTQLPDLFRRSGEGVAGVERVIDRFAADTGDAATADYLRSLVLLGRAGVRGYNYGRRESPLPADDRARAAQRLTAVLEQLSRSRTRYERWALATLATFTFYEGNVAAAGAGFREYAQRFPASDYAWVAALRAGECAQAMNDAATAIAAYRAAASGRRGGPLPAVLGHAAAARVLQRSGDIAAALAEYRRALTAWDADYGPDYGFVRFPQPGDIAANMDERFAVKRLELAQRVDRLRVAVDSPAGGLLERGQWLLEQHEWTDAIGAFEQLLARYPGSPHTGSARYRLHVARLRSAVAATSSGSAEQANSGLQTLERLAADPDRDVIVSFANITRATIRWKQGASAEAAALMNEALAEWQSRQREATTSRTLTALEQDVTAIRALLTKPAKPSTPYRMVKADISVMLADNDLTVVAIDRSQPAQPNELFLTAEEATLLDTVARSFASRPGEPEQAMYKLLQWWNTFFEAGPPAWGSLNLEAHPFLWRVEFIDRSRTHAVAQVLSGDSTGHAVTLEKVGGVWRVVRVGREWVA